MSPTEQGTYLVLGLFGLLALGFPIALSLLSAGLIGILAMNGWRSADYLLGTLPYSISAEFAFIVIPLFLFMGHMAYSAGISAKGFQAARAWIGHFTGGLATSAVVACGAFATVSGSSIATAATVSKIAIPELLKAGYSKKLSGACVAVGGTLGVLIPPSTIMVLYSIATETPIPELFIAGVVPGLLTILVYAIGIWVMVKRDPSMKTLTVQPRMGYRERLKITFSSWEILLIFIAVMGTLYTGIATASEAAGIGAFVALGIAIYRGTSWAEIKGGLQASGASTASIFFLIIGAGVFSAALATTQLPQSLAAWAIGLDLHPVILLICLLIPFLILGCFVDAASMILLTMPVVFPIVKQAGIDPVLFGILVVKMTEIGCITPPVGLNVFVVATTNPQITVREIFQGIMPFFIMEIIIVGLLIAFPAITLFAIR
ncbi:TRAP transporter large permease [Zwartia vadi]|uniref:TRAP transporter large permease n=1 Tax=Zwartia vadi TaxID=3058168 RepID=UPI0025B6297E|nr:TRAP transporter large permease [Zwartia vadi]MDN3987574.1 TRAP transporter large permease [Zwartia vadi]